MPITSAAPVASGCSQPPALGHPKLAAATHPCLRPSLGWGPLLRRAQSERGDKWPPLLWCWRVSGEGAEGPGPREGGAAAAGKDLGPLRAELGVAGAQRDGLQPLGTRSEDRPCTLQTPARGSPVHAEDALGEQAGRLFAEWRFNGTIAVTLLQWSPGVAQLGLPGPPGLSPHGGPKKSTSTTCSLPLGCYSHEADCPVPLPLGPGTPCSLRG